MTKTYKISIINAKTQKVKRTYNAEFEGEVNQLQTILDKRYYPSVVKIENFVFGR